MADQQFKYERWWKGKKCRKRFANGPFKRVSSIKLYGPPSFVYGVVELHYEDGTTDTLSTASFKPGKHDVEVSP